MTAYSKTLELFIGGSTTETGPTVAVGDTITLTVTAFTSGSATPSNNTNCSTSGQVTIGIATANAIFNFSGSSYSVRYDGPFGTWRVMQGTVNSADNTPENYTNLAGNKTGAALDRKSVV